MSIFKGFQISVLVAAVLSSQTIHASLDPSLHLGQDESDALVKGIFLDPSVTSFGDFTSALLDQHPFIADFSSNIEQRILEAYRAKRHKDAERKWTKHLPELGLDEFNEEFCEIQDTLAGWSEDPLLEENADFKALFDEFVAKATQKFSHLDTREHKLAKAKKEFDTTMQEKIDAKVTEIQEDESLMDLYGRASPVTKNWFGRTVYEKSWSKDDIWLAQFIRAHIRAARESLPNPLLQAVGIEAEYKFLSPTLSLRSKIRCNNKFHLSLLIDLRKGQLEVLDQLGNAVKGAEESCDQLLVAKIRLIAALKGSSFGSKYYPEAHDCQIQNEYEETMYEILNRDLRAKAITYWQSFLEGTNLDPLEKDDLSYLAEVLMNYYEGRHSRTRYLSIQHLLGDKGCFNPNKKLDLLNVVKAIGYLHAGELSPDKEAHKYLAKASRHLLELSKSRSKKKQKLLFALRAVECLERTVSNLPGIELQEQDKAFMSEVFAEAIRLSDGISLCRHGLKTVMNAYLGLAILSNDQIKKDGLIAAAKTLQQETIRKASETEEISRKGGFGGPSKFRTEDAVFSQDNQIVLIRDSDGDEAREYRF